MLKRAFRATAIVLMQPGMACVNVFPAIILMLDMPQVTTASPLIKTTVELSPVLLFVILAVALAVVFFTVIAGYLGMYVIGAACTSTVTESVFTSNVL